MSILAFSGHTVLYIAFLIILFLQLKANRSRTMSNGERKNILSCVFNIATQTRSKQKSENTCTIVSNNAVTVLSWCRRTFNLKLRRTLVFRSKRWYRRHTRFLRQQIGRTRLRPKTAEKQIRLTDIHVGTKSTQRNTSSKNGLDSDIDVEQLLCT